MSIRAILLDWDNTLCNCADMHYEALNEALLEINEKYIIHKDEHISFYNGLPTKEKLNKLSAIKKLPLHTHKNITSRKQELTKLYIQEKFRIDHKKINLLASLEDDGYKIGCCSNSIRETLHLMLEKSGMKSFFECIYSNEDVFKPKPNPECYRRAMQDLGVFCWESLIVEDNQHGLRAGYLSGGHLMPVKSPDDVTRENIDLFLKVYE